MIAREILSDKVPPIKHTETSEVALDWMNAFCVDHLAVIDGNRFIGLVSNSEIIDQDDLKKVVGTYPFSTHKSYVDPTVHVFEVIKLACELDLTLIPVVDDKNEYIGSITLESIVKYFSRIASVKDPGAILTLELNTHDYSLSEIARHVESNNTRILTSYVLTNPEQGTMRVTIKLDKEDITNVVSTFERFDYKIVAKYQESAYFEDLKDRFDSLMKYLNI